MVEILLEFLELCAENLPSELPKLLLNINLYIEIIT